MPLVAETDRMAPAPADALASCELLSFVPQYPPLEEILGGAQIRPYELFHAIAAMGGKVRVRELRAASRPPTAERLELEPLVLPRNGLLRESLLYSRMRRAFLDEFRRARANGRRLCLYQQVPGGIMLKGGLLPVHLNPGFFLFPLARRLGVPTWAAMHDLAPDHEFSDLRHRERIAARDPAYPAPRRRHALRVAWLAEKEQRFALRHADFITVVSERMRQELTARYGLPADRIAVFRAGINPALVEGLPPWTPPADGVWRIGTLGSAADADIPSLLEAMRRLPALAGGVRARLLLAGGSAAWIRNAYAGDGTVEIEALPGIRYGDFARFASQVDLWVNPLGDEPYFHLTWPLKIPMNVATGRPVIITDTPEADHSGLRDFLWLAGGSGESLAGAMARIIREPEQARLRAAQGRDFVLERMSWQAITRDLVREFFQVR
jgi:glycosyltransferase involved in cell wall biosynthesis